MKKRLDGNDYVPNSYVNDDGKPNVNDSNVQNDNDGRALVRILEDNLCYAFAPAADLAAGFCKFGLDF